MIEPYLIQQGFLQRTPRGRMLTANAFRHLGLAEPARDPAQFGLFGGGEDDDCTWRIRRRPAAAVAALKYPADNLHKPTRIRL